MAERNELCTPHVRAIGGTLPASVPSPFAAPADIPRFLRLTFEDDLLLTRYQDPIPIQPEPESQSLQTRRAKILAATTTNTNSEIQSPQILPVAPGNISFNNLTLSTSSPLTPNITPPPLSLSPSSSTTSTTTSPYQMPVTSPITPITPTTPSNTNNTTTTTTTSASQSAPFMQQPLQQSAVGRPRGMSSARVQPPHFTKNVSSTSSANETSPRAPSLLRTTTSSSTTTTAEEQQTQLPQQTTQQTNVITPVPRHPLVTRISESTPTLPPTPPVVKQQQQQQLNQIGSTTTQKQQQQQQQNSIQSPLASSGRGDGNVYSSPYHASLHRRIASAAPLISPLPVRPNLTAITTVATSSNSSSSSSSTSSSRINSNTTSANHQKAENKQKQAPEKESSGLINSSTTSSPEQTSTPASAPSSPLASPENVLQQEPLMPPLWSPKRTRSCSPVTMPQKPVVNDWNTQFAVAIEEIGKLTHNSHSDERIKAYEKLSLLAADFDNTVRTYAKIIISEVYLPKEQKTIKPIEIGGIAGGDKYIVHGILFKFAVDSKGQFSGDEFASKVAGHELKSLVHIYMCWERGVHFPMMTLVDYRGFRIVGMPLLPINGTETLVHGSNDAGHTIRTCPYLEERLKSIGEKLNLKEHLVGIEGKPFYTPIDLEGHLGFDGKYYLVDFSRLFPPQSLTGHKLGNLYQLLRPEFVRNYEIPLCSDAFSKFTCPDHPDMKRRTVAEEHNIEIDKATSYLTGTVVPNFAKRLLELPIDQRDEFPLIMLMHESGINVRYLGLIFTILNKQKDEWWCSKIFIEMAARTIRTEIKALLRKKMRELRHPGESQYRAAVISHLNIVFGSSPASQRHWSSCIMPELESKFPGFETQIPWTQIYPQWVGEGALHLGLGDGRCLLFKSVSTLLALHFASSTWHELSTNPVSFERYQPLNDTDLKELRERVKEMNVAAHSTAFMLKTKAMLSPNPEERARLLQLASQQFSRALECNPDNKVSLRNNADCLVLLGHFERAVDMYIRALQSDPEDTNTLYKFAIALDKTGHLDEAEEYYVRALEACPQHSNCFLCYADFLWHLRKNPFEAEHFYAKAIEVDATNFAACNNFACFLVVARRDYVRAERLFTQCVNGSPENSIFVNNLASFLLHICRNPQEARSVLQTHKPKIAAPTF